MTTRSRSRSQVALPLAAACLFTAGLVACSSLLGFDDLTSAPDAGGEGAAGDAAMDSTTDGAVSTPPGAPSDVVVAAAGLVTTLAGSGTAEFKDGMGAAASFNAPMGLAVDAAHNVYVADSLNHRIRKVTPAGLVTTVAGTGTASFVNGDAGASSTFNTPTGVIVNAAGEVFVADSKNHSIRKVTAGGTVSTLGGDGTPNHFDGLGPLAEFDLPQGLAADSTGNIFIADTGNSRVRRLTALGQSSSTAGGSGPPQPGFMDGQGSSALFNELTDLALDSADNVYIADAKNHRIRKMTADPALDVSTLAGSDAGAFADGVGDGAHFDTPSGVALDTLGNVYVADTNNHRLRKVTPAGVVTTIAGATPAFADGVLGAARFKFPVGVAVDDKGVIYVGDTSNHRIRKVITASKPGELAVTWRAPATSGSSPITGYTATATAPSHVTRTCTSVADTSCTITGLTSGVAYTISVTATNGLTSPPSAPATATPN